MPKMIEVFRTSDTTEALLMESMLQTNGLKPIVHGAHLASMVGVGSHVVPVRVLVPRGLADEARALVEVMRAVAAEQPDPNDVPMACVVCGADWEPGFDVCWQCQSDRSARP